MKKKVLSIPLLWLNFCWTPLLAKDWLSMPMSDEELHKWVVGKHESKKDVEATFWVPKGENMDAWTKKFGVQTFRKPRVGPSLQSLADQLKGEIARACPDLVWKIIESSANEVFYELSYENCQGKDMHEIGKWVQGKDSQFWLEYQHKSKDLDPDERTVWMQIIGDTKVEQGR